MTKCLYCRFEFKPLPDGRSHYSVCPGVAQLNPKSPDPFKAVRKSKWPDLVKALRDGRSAAAHAPKPHRVTPQPRTRAQQAALEKARANQKQNRE